jgi:hypothetical protein
MKMTEPTIAQNLTVSEYGMRYEPEYLILKQGES